MLRPLLLLAALAIGLGSCSDPELPAEDSADAAGAGQEGDEQAAVWSLTRFKRECLDHMSELTRGHNREWGMGKATRWDADLEKGFITWTFVDKYVRAPIQVIGTYDPLQQSMLWGWDHPSVPHELGKDARTLRNWGKEHAVKPLTHRQIICSESDAWTYTAMAAKLAGANGVYRGTAEQVLIFFTFGKVIIEPREES